MGWIANIFIVFNLLLLALTEKKKIGCLAGVIGNFIWANVGFQRGNYDLVFIASLATLINLMGLIKWSRGNPYLDRMIKDERKRSGKFFWEK